MKRLTLSIALALSIAAPALADMLPGYDRFDVQSAHRARLIAASVWYPAANPTFRAPIGENPIFKPTMAFMGPAIAEGRHPLVLFSHGSGGKADGLGWLLSELANRGAIVLAVDHPGSTGGDSSPRRSVDLGARAKDLSAALDHILADPAFVPFIDQDRISVVGFSLGGTTAMNLAGLRVDGKVQDERCNAGPDAADCWFFKRGGVRFADIPGVSADARDSRIVRAVAVDPGFGGAVMEESLQAVSAQVHFVNLGGRADRMGATDVGPDGNGLATRLPGATYSAVEPANHFTFLALCKDEADAILKEEGEDPLCTDPEGAVRSELHDRLVVEIVQALGL